MEKIKTALKANADGTLYVFIKKDNKNAIMQYYEQLDNGEFVQYAAADVVTLQFVKNEYGIYF